MAVMLEVEARGPVLFVRLDRPEVRNAFNAELITLLKSTFDHLPAGIRAVVLSGNGAAFCAGGDLEWMRKAASYSPEENARDAQSLADMLASVANCAAFVLTVVHGPAYGGGAGLVCASDYVLATDGASFAFSEVRLGLIPATISPYAVAKIGQGHARALFMSGLAFDGTRALRIGMVHELVPPAELEPAIDRVLKAVLSAGPDAVLKSRSLATGDVAGSASLAQALADARSGDEGKEGVAAFLEKRRASFSLRWPVGEGI